MIKVTCAILEDEVPAQEVLKSFISKVEWLDLSAVFKDSLEALEYFKSNNVDVIFLDIQVPELSGLEFLRILKHPPQVIITSAYSDHAIEAFELDVRDYIMKPFSFDRFLKSVNRIAAQPDPGLIHHFQSVGNDRNFAFFNVNKTMVKVFLDDVLFIESMREYIYIHTSSGKIITKFTLTEVEKLLGNNFLRIHRSFIVNVRRIDAYNAEEIIVKEKSLPIGVNFKSIVETVLAQFTNRPA